MIGQNEFKLEIRSKLIPFGLILIILFTLLLIPMIFLIMDFAISFSILFPLILLIFLELLLVKWIYSWTGKGEIMINDLGIIVKRRGVVKKEFMWSDIREVKKTVVDGEVLVIIYSGSDIQIISSSRTSLSGVRKVYLFLKDYIRKNYFHIRIWEEIPE
ncbi:MAG: hypothetical protein ACMUIG_00320 [Thermoplasmatota archaeon]